MHHRRPVQSRGPITAAIALAVALPFNVLAAEPTPDPPEPYLVGVPGSAAATLALPGTAHFTR
jgi:hypothetical protein